MNIDIIIAISFFIGVFVSSTIGFGRTLFAVSIASLFIDIKLIVILDLFVALTAESFIILSAYRHINYKVLYFILPYSIIGLIVGNFTFHYIDTVMLMKVFAVLLIGICILSYLNIVLRKSIKKILLVVSGFLSGILGVGAMTPAIIQDEFKNKHGFRVTLVTYTFLMNIIRVIQYYIQDDFAQVDIVHYYWMPIIIAIGVYLGYIVHKKINEKLFKKLITTILFILGIIYLLK